MAVIGIDLGATKLSLALFSEEGEIMRRQSSLLENRTGGEVGLMIISAIEKLIGQDRDKVHAIGLAVPGISRIRSGTVWAPNIPGWHDYPLRTELKKAYP